MLLLSTLRCHLVLARHVMLGRACELVREHPTPPDTRGAMTQVRAARNLPIKLLAEEYERILRRRLKRVGGSPEDGALAEMVASFRRAARAS